MGISDLLPWRSLAENTVGKVADKLISYLPISDEQKQQLILKSREMDLEEIKLAYAEQMQQIAINLEEAKSEKWWKAGWRPFFGWTCGAAFAYKFVAQPFLVFIVLCFNPEWHGFSKLPEINWPELAAVAMPLLGISRDRSNEKRAIISSK